jgi:hypothetical protein
MIGETICSRLLKPKKLVAKSSLPRDLRKEFLRLRRMFEESEDRFRWIDLEIIDRFKFHDNIPAGIHFPPRNNDAPPASRHDIEERPELFDKAGFKKKSAEFARGLADLDTRDPTHHPTLGIIIDVRPNP